MSYFSFLLFLDVTSEVVMMGTVDSATFRGGGEISTDTKTNLLEAS
jgi:hypothetical protein